MEVIEDLIAKKSDFIAQGLYIEANQIKMKIGSFKSSNKTQSITESNLNKQKQLEAIDFHLNQDIKEASAYYEDQLYQFIEGAKKAEVELFEVHRTEMTEYIHDLDEKIPKTVKFSKKYLDLKRNEVNAVKHDNLLQANYYKEECDLLEHKEVEEFTKKRNMKIDQMVKHLTNRQDKEKRNLKQKLDLNYEKIIMEKKERIEFIKKKYNNQRIDVERKWNREKRVN